MVENKSIFAEVSSSGLIAVVEILGSVQKTGALDGSNLKLRSNEFGAKTAKNGPGDRSRLQALKMARTPPLSMQMVRGYALAGPGHQNRPPRRAHHAHQAHRCAYQKRTKSVLLPKERSACSVCAAFFLLADSPLLPA